MGNIDAELKEIFEKIDDCDFEGVRQLMIKLAKSKVEPDEKALSDFLAYYSYMSHSIISQQSEYIKSSEIAKSIAELKEKHDALLEKESGVFAMLFEYFTKFEDISVSKPLVPRFAEMFDARGRTNYRHIKSFLEGKESPVNFDNCIDVFENQLSVYAALKPCGTNSIMNLGGGKTNVHEGLYWRFVELRKEVSQKKDLLSENVRAIDEMRGVEEAISDLRSNYHRNDVASSAFADDFKVELEKFKRKEAVKFKSPFENLEDF